LAVMLTRTKRAVVGGTVIGTVLAVAGLKVYVAEGTTVANVEPSVLVCTDRVCVRVAHAVAGGSFSVTLPMLVAAPRSTCSHCGKAPLALSQ
jgi:hypothetical protein